MENSEKSLCLILLRSEIYEKIEPVLKDRYSLLHTADIHRADALIRQRNISCIIAHVDSHLETSTKILAHLTTLFPKIPVVVITKNYDLESARTCGKAGVDHVVADCDLHYLSDVVQLAICEKSP